MKTTLLMSAILAGLIVTAADAQDRTAGGPGGAGMDFATLDANADGALTPEDMATLQAERFAAADTDGDGALSEAEMVARATVEADERQAARMAERAAQTIERMDTNGDGLLQADEMAEGPERGIERMFARFDTDEDGSISEAEFDAAQAKMAERGEGRGDRDGGRRHGGGDNGPRDRG